MALSTMGCGAQAMPSSHVPSRAEPTPRFEVARADNLARLAPMARALIAEQAGEARWQREGVLAIEPRRCAALVPVESAGDCTLFALGPGRAALLVARSAPGCEEARCYERSWVFLPSHAAPLPLPARRLSDYHSLAVEIPGRRATALWLAGFRAYDDSARTAESAPPADDTALAILDYARCALAAGERELVCPTAQGALIALDPARGTSRLLTRRDGP